MIVDAHQHFWDPARGDYGWLKPDNPIHRVFSTVEKSVLIRADQELDGGDVLPGLVLILSDLLDRGRQPRVGD